MTGAVVVQETREGNSASAWWQDHVMRADEPVSAGGWAPDPPYDLSLPDWRLHFDDLRMYADLKGFP